MDAGELLSARQRELRTEETRSLSPEGSKPAQGSWEDCDEILGPELEVLRHDLPPQDAETFCASRRCLSQTDAIADESSFQHLNRYVMYRVNARTILEGFDVSGQCGPIERDALDLLTNNYEGYSWICEQLADWMAVVISVNEVWNGEKAVSTPPQPRQNLLSKPLASVIEAHFSPEKLRGFMHANRSEENWRPPNCYWPLMHNPDTRETMHMLYQKCPTSEFLGAFAQDSIEHENALFSAQSAASPLAAVSRRSQLAMITGNFSVFLRNLCELLAEYLARLDSDCDPPFLEHICASLSHSENAYIYSQALLHFIPRWRKELSGCRRLSQILRQYVSEQHGHEVADLHLLFTNISNYPELHRAVRSIRRRDSYFISDDDLTVLHKTLQRIVDVFDARKALLKEKSDFDASTKGVAPEESGEGGVQGEAKSRQSSSSEGMGPIATSHSGDGGETTRAQDASTHVAVWWSAGGADSTYGDPGLALEEEWDDILMVEHHSEGEARAERQSEGVMSLSDVSQYISLSNLPPADDGDRFSDVLRDCFDRNVPCLADLRSAAAPVEDELTTAESDLLERTGVWQLSVLEAARSPDFPVFQTDIPGEDLVQFKAVRSSTIEDRLDAKVHIGDERGGMEPKTPPPVPPLGRQAGRSSMRPPETFELPSASQQGDIPWLAEYDRLRSGAEPPPIDALRESDLLGRILDELAAVKPRRSSEDVRRERQLIEVFLLLSTYSAYELVLRREEEAMEEEENRKNRRAASGDERGQYFERGGSSVTSALAASSASAYWEEIGTESATPARRESTPDGKPAGRMGGGTGSLAMPFSTIGSSVFRNVHSDTRMGVADLSLKKAVEHRQMFEKFGAEITKYRNKARKDLFRIVAIQRDIHLPHLMRMAQLYQHIASAAGASVVLKYIQLHLFGQKKSEGRTALMGVSSALITVILNIAKTHRRKRSLVVEILGQVIEEELASAGGASLPAAARGTGAIQTKTILQSILWTLMMGGCPTAVFAFLNRNIGSFDRELLRWCIERLLCSCRLPFSATFGQELTGFVKRFIQEVGPSLMEPVYSTLQRLIISFHTTACCAWTPDLPPLLVRAALDDIRAMLTALASPAGADLTRKELMTAVAEQQDSFSPYISDADSTESEDGEPLRKRRRLGGQEIPTLDEDDLSSSPDESQTNSRFVNDVAVGGKGLVFSRRRHQGQPEDEPHTATVQGGGQLTGWAVTEEVPRAKAQPSVPLRWVRYGSPEGPQR